MRFIRATDGPNGKVEPEGAWLWIQLQQNTSVRASPVSAWAARALALASSSVITWQPRCAIPLGIFSLLIALLLLFAL
jgi:hypothetical protein